MKYIEYQSKDEAIVTREGDMGLRIREWKNERGGKDMFYSPDGTIWFPTREAANALMIKEEKGEVIDKPVNRDKYYGCTFCGVWTSTGYETERKDWSCESCAVSLNGTWLYQYGYVRFDGIKVVGNGKAKGLLGKYKVSDTHSSDLSEAQRFYDDFYGGAYFDNGYETNHNSYHGYQKREVKHKMHEEYTVGKGVKDAK